MNIKIRLTLAAMLGGTLVACGGGGASNSSGENVGTATGYAISGSVPGTLIEAFCSNGQIYSTQSEHNGTAQHPFTLNLPRNVECRLVMTTNENDPANRVVTPIRLTKNGAGSIAFASTGSAVNLGYIDLKTTRSAMRADVNQDGVEDNPLVVDISLSASDVGVDTAFADPMDVDRDGVIDTYEDDDGDRVPNRYDDDDDGDGTPDLADNDFDSDHDGIGDDEDSDDDNDGDYDGDSTQVGGGNSSVLVPDGGQLLAAQCFQCHGTEGHSVSRIEGLAGEAGEIASEMREMKYSTNLNDIMHRQAKGYTESEIDAIAAYFANKYGGAAGGGHDGDDD
ncbi:MAG: hypothetical protein JG718_04640 [Candidatus Thiothrix moscowensis]|nr:hypothetical protein [Candidatus Thiothrix moscowensis]